MPVFPFTRIDHVQLAMPGGAENVARAFYVELLGMTEIGKPPELAKRGGCWFASGDVQIHLGVEDNFRASKKAHPALQCSDFAGLSNRLEQNGYVLTVDQNNPGVTRAYIHDPFGNRIELIAE